ncbi:MAG: maleylacetate reductase [Bacteroidota bacterium]
MFQQFEYHSPAVGVQFGAGSLAKLPHILGRGNVLAIASPRGMQALAPYIGTTWRTFDEVVPQVPQWLVDKASKRLDKIDVVLALGGGSAIGLAKALALQSDFLPIVAIPTTYSGSEMTNIYGISQDGQKTTGRDDKVQPKVVIYDPVLTQSLAFRAAATSALNALAHLMEASYAFDRNPVSFHLALQGIHEIIGGLEQLIEAKTLTPAANEQLLLGAYLGGKCLGEVSMALHHKCAHVLGGSFGLEHALVHSVLQPYVLAYQWDGLDAQTQADLQSAYGHESPPRFLWELLGRLALPQSLREIGFNAGQIETAVKQLLQKPYPNPVVLEEGRLRQMLERAIEGRLEND